VSYTALKSASFVVRQSRSCRDTTQITTREGAQNVISSTGERAAGVDEHSADYLLSAHLEDSASAHLEDSGLYLRQHEHEDQPYRQGNPADGDELPCAIEHSAEHVSCKFANLVLLNCLEVKEMAF
jgi:hypothetical protein